jgi:hypothetical protein
MTATVFYDNVNEIALISNTFLNTSQVAADPSTVACVVTDPSNTSVTHTFNGVSPADIVKVSTGKYTLSVSCSPAVAGVAGLWQFEWIGTGAVSDVQPGTWRVLPSNIGSWYIGLEEFKDRLGVEDSEDDAQAQISIQSVCQWINDYCVTMDTPVLTADLKWVPAGDLVLGQELVGVDEFGPEDPAYRLMNSRRMYRRSTVLAIPRRMAQCIRLTLADGRTVTCATDHRWLVRRHLTGKERQDYGLPASSRNSGYRWVHTQHIVPGDEIASPLRTWSEGTSYEDGWAAGLYDGEGWLAKTGPSHATVGFAQNPGPVLDELTKYLENGGLPYTLESSKDCIKVMVGQRWAAMELMGRLRPRRLLPKADQIWEGGRAVRPGPNNVRVIAAEPAGIQEVVSLGTSTGTYLANGLISHNCGRHFNRITETRTFEPDNIWLLNIDDVVSVSAVTLDMDGDGIYELPLTQGTDYQLRLGDHLYNVNATGIARPYTQLQIIQTGTWLPFTWPYTQLNRVQMTAVWGWPAVPPGVTEAAFILAADIFKMKDAPFGVSGVSDYGVVKISANPWLVEMLRPYVNSRRKVGV